MRREARLIKTLVYYDGPQLILMQDQFGVFYLCLLVERDETFDTFLCAPISLIRLHEFYQEKVDLKDVYTHAESDELFSVRISDLGSESFEIVTIDSEITEDWLPEAGFYYEEDLEFEESIVEEAHTKRRAILHLSLNPPEARAEYRINSLVLAEALKTFQTLVRHAYKKSLQNINKATKQTIDGVDFHTLDVFSVSQGSFTVHLQSRKTSDLFGYVDVAKAFERIDEITQNLEARETALAAIKQNKGHLASAYMRLLRLIIENDIPIVYSWITPDTTVPIRYSIPKNVAEEAYEAFMDVEELGVETLSLIGKFTAVDVDRRSWTFIDSEDDEQYSGTDSNISLSGVTVDTLIYKVIIEEKIEEILGTGREKTTAHLISYELHDSLNQDTDVKPHF